MFTIGEFARLAQVSRRLLRYYDEIDLFKPLFTDGSTNRRYYSAEQMPLLNRILALKELGLSLDQIRRMLSDNVSIDEMEGMLLLKKAEIEQQIRSEINRIHNIESRLKSIRNAESTSPLNVVLKQMPAQASLSLRTEVDSMGAGLELCNHIMRLLPRVTNRGFFFAIIHNQDLEQESYPIDFELGTFIDAEHHTPIPIYRDLSLQCREIPAVSIMATYVVEGWNESVLTGYSAIARWVELNGYRFAGPPRELALKLPQLPDGSDGVGEIQFPIEPINE